MKFYDPVTESLSFVGTHVALASHTLVHLLPVLRAVKGLPETQELAVFEEVEFEAQVRFEPIGDGRTLKDAELQSGDIIVFQTLPYPQLPRRVQGMVTDGASPAADTEHEPLITIHQFFEHVKNRVVVHVHKLPPQHHQGVREKERALQLTMDKRWTYDQVTSRIGQAVGCDPSQLRLTMHNPYSDLPKPQPIKYRGVESLQEMLTSFQKMSDILFYEQLQIPLEQFEAKKSLKISWHNSAAEEVKVLHLLLNKESTVADALKEIALLAPLSDAGTPTSEVVPSGVTEMETEPMGGSTVISTDGAQSLRRLRMMEVFNHRIYKIFQEHEEIDTINDQYWTIRAEEIPSEESDAGPEDKLIHVRYFP